jgi:hypothetical protein
MNISIEHATSAGVFQRLREQLNRHPVMASLLTAALVGSLIYAAVRNPAPPTPRGDFIDETTGESMVRSIADVPPLPGKDGGLTVVRAYYSVPTGDGQRKLLYLQKYSPETKAYLEQYLKEHRTGQPQFPDPQTAILVRKPEAGSPWVPLETPEGRAIAPDLWR